MIHFMIHSRGFCELAFQFADFVKAFGNVANDCRGPDRAILRVLQHNDRELDGDSPPALGQGRHRQEVAMPVVTFARLHDAIESGPMTGLEIGGNDQVEGASDGFISRKAKNPAGAGIPEINDACAVGSHDRV